MENSIPNGENAFEDYILFPGETFAETGGEGCLLIEDYLDHVFSPIVGLMPIDERQRLREEIRCHLDRFASSYEAEGLSGKDAALRAIDEFGRSDRVGDDFALSWMSRRIKGRLAKLIGWQNAVAVTCFGIATAWVSFLEQLHIFMLGREPSPAPITFGLSPAELRNYIPRPFPLPENGPTFWLLVASLVAAPLIAGAVAGWLAPIRSARAAYQAQMGLTIYSFVTGVLMLPACYGLFVALFQLFYWLPLGCLFVYLGAAARRRRACRFSPESVKRAG